MTDEGATRSRLWAGCWSRDALTAFPLYRPNCLEDEAMSKSDTFLIAF